MIILFLFILGICVGSFLNVLVDRLPRDESIAKGRSHCESCKHTLAWYDLVPLLSFLQLQGKCRYCHASLSFYYLIVELLTGTLFVVTFYFLQQQGFIMYDFRFTNIFLISYFLFLISSLVVIFFVDLKFGIIPDKILFPAIIITVLFFAASAGFTSQESQSATSEVGNRALSAIGAFLLFLFLHLATRGRGMGFGDVKYVILMGFVLGFPGIVVGLYIAFLTGAVISLILIAWGKKKLHGSTIPFGPFLVFGTVVAMFWGAAILQFFFPFLAP